VSAGEEVPLRVPHDGPMRWLGATGWREGDALVCPVRPRADGPFARGGEAPSSVSVELIAQAAAALLALDDEAPPRRGHLLAVRALALREPTLRLDDALRVRVRATLGGELASVQGEVLHHAHVVAAATLTVRREPR
jgi:predicted hotdog family 3-hydroxylacyl-ACP dehydratase